jgi:hypothetical protein
MHALLHRTPIGAHAHLMDRQPDGMLGCTRIAEAENRADRLALELLAPSAEVWQRVACLRKTSNFRAGVQHTVSILVRDFGLDT